MAVNHPLEIEMLRNHRSIERMIHHNRCECPVPSDVLTGTVHVHTSLSWTRSIANRLALPRYII